MENQNSGDVFISYRHCNVELVKPIVEELERRGITFFVDWNDIDYGDEYSNLIYRAIVDCKIMLLVLTEDVNGSKDIPRELRLACNKGKKIIPYKIGNFDISILENLEYDVCLFNPYEHPKQTSETIADIVNRIEEQLNELNSQPSIKFVLPPKIHDYVVEHYSIDPIIVNIESEHIDNPSVYRNDASLPRMPETLGRVIIDNKRLQTAIEKLQVYIHPALVQANEALEKAKAQYTALNERKTQGLRLLTPEVRQQLENEINNNPDCTKENLSAFIDEMDYRELANLYEQFDCCKKLIEANQEFNRVKKLRQEKCEQIVTELKSKILSNINSYTQEIEEYVDSALFSMLKDIPEFKDTKAPVPYDFIVNHISGLESVLCGLKSGKIVNTYARKYWLEKRPCVIIERERLQRENEILDRICQECHTDVENWKHKWHWLWIMLIIICVGLFILGVIILCRQFKYWPVAAGLLAVIILLGCFFKFFKLFAGYKIRTKYMEKAKQGNDLYKKKLRQCFLEIADEFFKDNDFLKAKNWIYLAADCQISEEVNDEQTEDAPSQSILKYADQYFRRSNNYPEAIMLFSSLAQRYGGIFRDMLNNFYLNYAQWSRQNGNLNLTISICEEMIKNDVCKSVASEMLAKCYCELGDKSCHYREELYKKSADLGYVPAMIKLGDLLCDSYTISGRINFDMAFAWYSEAAECGDALAYFKLAQCYENGFGVEKNRLKAYKLYYKSANMGCYKAKSKVDELEDLLEAVRSYDDDDRDEDQDDEDENED